MKIKILDGFIPTKAYKNDAGFDLYAKEDARIEANKTQQINSTKNVLASNINKLTVKYNSDCLGIKNFNPIALDDLNLQKNNNSSDNGSSDNYVKLLKSPLFSSHKSDSKKLISEKIIEQRRNQSECIQLANFQFSHAGIALALADALARGVRVECLIDIDCVTNSTNSKKANQLAHYIRNHNNIKPDSLVVLCVDRSEYILIAILAVLKAGGAYVPIDPSYPDERIRHILVDTRAELILTNELYEKKLEDKAFSIEREARDISIIALDNITRVKITYCYLVDLHSIMSS